MKKYLNPLSLKYKSICRCYTAGLPQILSAKISVSPGWMQDTFIFNLNSTDDSGGMMEDPVEMKASRKNKMNFHLMQLDTFWCMQLNASPQLATAALKCLCHLQQITYAKAVSQLSYTSNVRPGMFQSPMKTCEWRPQTKSLTAAWSLKKITKEPCLIVGVPYCNFIVISLQWNSVSINYYLISDKGYEKI